MNGEEEKMTVKLKSRDDIMSLKAKEFDTLREAAALALDAIQTYAPDYMHGLPKEKYVKALRKALQKEKAIPLSDEAIDKIIDDNAAITDQNLRDAIYMMLRDLEEAHGIVEE